MHILQKWFCVFFLSSFTFSALATPDFGPVDMGDFYASIPELAPSAKLGEVIKLEKIKTTIPKVQAWKMAYVSSDVAGRKTISTAIVAAPEGDFQGKRPVVAWAHGTTGTAQNCGPSQVINPAQPLNQYFLPTGNSWTDFGLPAMKEFINAGYVIVATDYQGLGAGGRHQYAVAATQGRDVINSIRAVTLIKDVHAGSKAVVYGWSQGGGATIAAAGLSDYLNAKGSAQDGIEILGFVAMAPFNIAVTIPKEQLNETQASAYFNGLSAQFGENVFNFTHYAQYIWGLTAAFPEIKLEDMFTPEGANSVNEIALRKCMHVAADTFNFAYGKNYKNMLRTDVGNAMAWLDANKKGSVLPVKPMAPVIIYFGTQDKTVPPIMGKLYFEQMCQMGANVTRIQLPGEQNHFTTPGVAQPMYVQWVADRFAGKVAANGCEMQEKVK